MAENPYTREATVTLIELVPEHGELPLCTAWQKNGENCWRRARFLQQGQPICGLHMGRPGTVFAPGTKEER